MSKRIIIYDDDEIMYETGEVIKQNFQNHYENIDITTIGDIRKNSVPMLIGTSLTLDIGHYNKDETIKLDETMMKRIAKFNKEKEIKKIDEEIKNKKKQLKELEEKIEDRQERWKKIQEFVAGIYDLDLADDDDDYDYDYD